jgi:hypothetical protein
MEAYDKVCRARPTATYCGLPLYWPAPPIRVSAKTGMHRFSWDMRLQPFERNVIADGGNVNATGAVPRRTYDEANAPWAPAGSYSVRLTAEGKSYAQPIMLKLDPRVKTTAAALQQLTSLSREMWERATAVRATYAAARAFSVQLATAGGPEAAALKARVDSLAPAAVAGGRGGRGGRGGGGPLLVQIGAPAESPTLDRVSGALMAAAMGMQGAEVAPTDRQVAACAAARAQATTVMAQWTKLTTTELAALNARRKAAGEPAIRMP